MAYQDNIRTKWITTYPNAGGNEKVFCDIFTTIFEHYSSHPGYRRIAYWTGSISNTTGGIGYYSEARHFGEQAWGVWRAVSSSVPYDIAVKYTTPATAYSSLRGQWRALNDAGISIVCCYNTGGAPWNGTTGNIGNDSFTAGSTQPWRAGSHTTLRSNGSTGTDATNRNGLLQTIYNGDFSGGASFLITSDYENTFICTNPVRIPNNGSTPTISFFGVYQPLTSSTSANIFQVNFESIPYGTTDYGAPGYRTGGGIVYTGSTTPGVRVLKLDLNLLNNGPTLPSYGYYNPYTYNKIVEYPVVLYTTESTFRSLGIVNPNFLRYTETQAYHFKQYNTGTRITAFSNISTYTFTSAIQTGTKELEARGAY